MFTGFLVLGLFYVDMEQPRIHTTLLPGAARLFAMRGSGRRELPCKSVPVCRMSLQLCVLCAVVQSQGAVLLFGAVCC